MELYVSLLRFLTVGVLILCCYGSVSVPRGEFVSYPIPKEDYFSSLSLKAEEISFNFSTENGYAELPSWLRLEQRRADADAFLYGAPNYWDKSAVVEIIGWDKAYNYSWDRKLVDFVVTPREFPWFQAEFLITNMNLDVFLENDTYSMVRKIVEDHYWPAVNLAVTGVESALDRGGRIPLPNSNDFEGVYVRVGSRFSWEEANSSLQTGQEPDVDYFKMKNLMVKWSNFSWLDLRTVETPAAKRQALLPEDKVITTNAYEPREFDDSPRDFEDDFILVVVIPIIIILLFVLLLSVIMCFGREGRHKRDLATPHTKLTHHHNIQRSTLRLRELSKQHTRDQSAPHTPSSQDPTRPGHGRGHNQYERVPEDLEDERTDGRNAPPPYRMPPGSSAGAQQV